MINYDVENVQSMIDETAALPCVCLSKVQARLFLEDASPEATLSFWKKEQM